MLNKKIKIVFMGTPDFSVPCLNALIQDERFEIILTITQKDKKIGRKQIMTPPPVKIESEKNNITVWQPKKISDCKLPKDVDLIVVIAYGQILPQHILDLPKHGCINIHASLLPKYRGSACIQAPLLNGDRETGITIMQMEAGLDTGPIITQEKIQIIPEETAHTLHDRLTNIGAKILPQVLIDYIEKKIKSQPQDDSKSSYVGILKKQDGKIDWKKSALEIERMIRALNPWPGTFGKTKDNLLLKILKVENNILKINKHKTGELFLYQEKLAIQCGQDSLVIQDLQLAGKKAMHTAQFLQGNSALIKTIIS